MTDDHKREDRRFPFAVPLKMELSNGLLRRVDTVPAILVDLSKYGAALVLAADSRLRVKRRYRVEIDDHAGIVEIRNIVAAEPSTVRGAEVPGDAVRIGVTFKVLGLELQELVADSVQHAEDQNSRLSHSPAEPHSRDPFAPHPSPDQFV